VALRLRDPGIALLAAALGIAVAWAAALSPGLALAGAGAVIVGAMVVAQAEALLLVMVAALPWEGSLDWPTEKANVVKLLGLLLFAAWLLRTLARRESPRLTVTLVPALLVGMSVLLALAVSPDPAAGVLDAVRFALFIAFFFLVVQMVRTRRQVQRIVQVIVLSGSVAAVWGLYGFLVLGRDRAGGPIKDPNDFAYLLACLLPLAAFLIGFDRPRRALWIVCFVAVAACTAATLSRGALVGLAVAVAWGLATRRISLRAVVAAVVSVAAVGLLAFVVWGPAINHKLESKERIAATNVSSRRALWRGAVDMWSARPLTGVGPGRFGTEAPRYVHDEPNLLRNPLAHNTYLQALAETGVLGLAAFLAFLGTTWQLLTRARRRARRSRHAEDRQLLVAMQGTLLIAVASGFFLSVGLTTPFWLIGALAVVVAAIPPDSIEGPSAAAA
jgi:putative inorganic carbon (HCO3(-)) transporter